MTGKERKIATITGSIFWGAFQIVPALDAIKSDLKLFESLKNDCGKQVDAFIAGNDEEVLQTVKELVSTAGFNPIVAGNLSVSRTLENMQLLLIQLGIKYNYNWLAGRKILHN